MSPAVPAPPAAPTLRCRGLRKRFGSTVAVDGIDLEVAAGEIVGLLGLNGASKTTTIRILTTLIPADDGTIEVFGHDVAAQPFTTRRLIGYVPHRRRRGDPPCCPAWCADAPAAGQAIGSGGASAAGATIAV